MKNIQDNNISNNQLYQKLLDDNIDIKLLQKYFKKNNYNYTIIEFYNFFGYHNTKILCKSIQNSILNKSKKYKQTIVYINY